MKRVVVTGAGAVTALGSSRQEILRNLAAGKVGLEFVDAWAEVKGLRSRIGGVVRDRAFEKSYDRKKSRSMSPGALMAVRSAELALIDAGILGEGEPSQGRPIVSDLNAVGVAFGSCMAGPNALMEIAVASANKSLSGIPASHYTKVMSHTCAASVSMYFGFQGRIIPTCSACTSGSQAIGYAFEAIRSGQQRMMVAGGAEELCIGLVGLFDSMNATSPELQNPEIACRPFAHGRGGLVVSEGACSLLLEEYDSAKSRGATILAEVVGFGTNSNGAHITDPEPEVMAETLRLGLRSAGIPPETIGFVHAHATATESGDIAEARATSKVFGDSVPVGALKSYFGHTLGAAGALEAWLSVEMMREKEFFPIRNLTQVDDRCEGLDYIKGQIRRLDTEYVMSNNFAFGGVNTSLVFRAI